MSLWLPCGLHGSAVPNTVTVTVTVTINHCGAGWGGSEGAGSWAMTVWY
jgi:hypothetical protein